MDPHHILHNKKSSAATATRLVLGKEDIFASRATLDSNLSLAFHLTPRELAWAKISFRISMLSCVGMLYYVQLIQHLSQLLFVLLIRQHLFCASAFEFCPLTVDPTFFLGEFDIILITYRQADAASMPPAATDKESLCTTLHLNLLDQVGWNGVPFFEFP